ncbi:MAG: hypothetical protein RR843_10910 [Clostridia bacterium]
MQKPRRIAPGDTLGFVAASSTLADPALLPRAISAAEAMGYKVALGDSCTAKYGYLAGDDALRAGEHRHFGAGDAGASVVVRVNGEDIVAVAADVVYKVLDLIGVVVG